MGALDVLDSLICYFASYGLALEDIWVDVDVV